MKPHKGRMRQVVVWRRAAGLGRPPGKLVWLWDLGGDRPRVKGSLEAAGPLVFAPDGKTLVTGHQDGALRLWDLGGARPRERASLPAQGLISPGEGVKVWDLGAAEPRERAELPGVSLGPAAILTFTPDGKTLAVIQGLWQREPPRTVYVLSLWAVGGMRPERRASYAAGTLAVAPDARALAAHELGGGVRLWDVSGDRPRARATLPGKFTRPLGLYFTPDGKTLVINASLEGTHQVWDVSGPEPRVMPRVERPGEAAPGAVAVAPDGQTLVVGGMEGLQLRRLKEGEFRRPPGEEGHEGGVSALAFAPDGRALAAETPEGAVQLWDLRDGRLQERAVLKADDLRVSGLAFAPDGRRLATAYGPGWLRPAQGCRVIVWDAGGRKLQEWPFPGPVSGVAFAPDGRHLATANSNGTVYIVRLRRGGTP
jgi:WD40 repeat protein